VASFLSPMLRSPERPVALRNQRSGRIVAHTVVGAFDSESRRRGLLGRDSLAAGTALIIAPSSAIHTAFMRFPIDVAFVRRTGEVVRVTRHLRPWRLAGSLRAFAVIEFAAGTLGATDVKTGDVLALDEGEV
jgi:uncharacterized protein